MELLIILIFVVSNIGTLLLVKRLGMDVTFLRTNHLDELILDRLSSIARRERALKQLIQDEHRKTRKESQEIKTRLADEESDDQKAKRKAREEVK
ncbi:MAG: hypothetical protein M3R02_26285 [Chloroflexota bacterium]|nr:hypothetical protein [Chloroflexota bacterium]